LQAQLPRYVRPEGEDGQSGVMGGMVATWGKLRAASPASSTVTFGMRLPKRSSGTSSKTM
jgi:hypothetical protein